MAYHLKHVLCGFYFKICMYIRCKQTWKIYKEHTHKKNNPSNKKITSVNILVYVFSFFSLPSMCTSLFYLFKMGYCSVVCFFFFFPDIAIDCELFPMDESLLKIDVPVEAVIPWTSRFITILLFKKAGEKEMPYGHPNLGNTVNTFPSWKINSTY